MAKPSLNFYQALHVGKVKTDVIQYETIQAAITAAPALTGKRFAIYVHPGQYDEAITMKDFCDVIAIGGREETIINNDSDTHDEPTVIGANALIKGFTIRSYGGAASTYRTRCVNAGTAGFEMEDCILTAVNSLGVTDITLNATASCDIRDCVVDSGGVAVTGALFTTGAQTYNVERTTFDGATDAIQVTTAITALNLTDCTVSDHFNMDGGTVTVDKCNMEAVTLGTADCDFNAEFSLFTGAFLTEAAAQTHGVQLRSCNFGGQNITNNATGSGTFDMYNCTNIAQFTNADTGTNLFYDCGITQVIPTAGTITAYGGRIGGCGANTCTSFVWWLNGDNLHVLENMVIQHAITAANAEDTIHLDAVRYTERITLADGVHIEGATSSTDTPTEIYDTTAAAVITAGAVECSIRRVKITQTNGGGTAYCLSVTLAAVLVFSHCDFECAGTDAIHMINGNLTLDKCDITDGDINLSAAACTLKMDHSAMVAGTLVSAATDFDHSVTCLYCDFNGQDIHLSAIGETTTEIRYCTDIDDFYDAGLTAGTCVIENSNITTASKNTIATATKAWTVRATTIGSLANDGGAGTGTITIYGGYLGACTDSTSPIVWWHDNLNELMVIEGMMVEHAVTAANVDGTDTIRLGKGSWTLLAVMDIEKSINFIGEGPEESQLTISNASPVFNVGDDTGHTDVTCTFQGLKIENSGTGEAIQLVSGTGTGDTTVVVRECILDGADCVRLDNVGNQTETFEAFETEFNATGVCIDVDHTQACDIDIHNCEFSAGEVVDLAGAAHTFDAWDCECGDGNVTGDANDPVVNLTRCNDVDVITNAGAGNWVIEHCTTGNIGTTSTGDITIENSTVGILTQTNAGGDMFVYNSYVAEANPTDGDMDFYECYIADVDSDGGTITVHGGNIALVTGATGAIVWWEGQHILKVMASTVNMKIMDAADAAAAGDVIIIGPGTFAEALALDTGVNACTYQGAGREDTIIQLAAADVVTITVDGVVLEDLTIEITGGAGHDCVTTANATVIRHCNIIATSAAVTECHGIATTGTGGVTVDGCDITSSGHASSDGIYLGGTGATVVMESIINATLADINQQADITGDLQTYNNELAGGGFKIGNNAAYNCYAHGDVFDTVTHDGAGHMFLQNEPNIALVREGMKIADGIALATADTPAAANPWTVLVGPGVYTEQITMDDYVSVIAKAGYEVTKITREVAAAHDEPTVTMESNCRLEGFTIESDGNGDLYRARCVTSDAKSDWLIKDCLFQHVDSAVAANQCVFVETSGTGMRLEHCRWSMATTDDIKRGLQVDAAGIEVLLQDCETYGEDYDFYLNEGKVETRKCMIRGGGWYITDDADSVGVSWDDDWNDGVAPVTFAGTNGEFADLSGAREYTCAATVLLGEAVYISAGDTVAEATNAAGAPLPAEGIVVWKSASDALTCYVKKNGYIYWANPAPAWAAGVDMWLGVDGAMVNARPADAIAQIIGVPKGTKEMLINITLTDAGTDVISTHLVLPELGLGAAQGIHDRWPVIIIDAVAQTCHFALKVPDDFLSLSKVYIVGIPTTGGTISCTVNTSAGDCEGDEATIQDTMSIVTETIVDDRLENLDVSAAFDVLGLVQGRMIGVQFVLDAFVTTTQFNVVGLYMEYVKA